MKRRKDIFVAVNPIKSYKNLYYYNLPKIKELTVLLLRLVRILRFDGVISPSSKWKGEGVELVGGGDSMEVSSPYFLYKSRHFVQRTPPSLALCQSLESVKHKSKITVKCYKYFYSFNNLIY